MPMSPSRSDPPRSASPRSQPPRLAHLLETALYVADLARSVAFYQRVFGFEQFLADERMVGLGVPGGGVLLLFRRGGSVQPSPTPGGTIPPHDGSGHLHVAFAMPLGERGAWEAHLAAIGVELESRVTWPRGGTSLYFRDPDGHSVEIATPGLWPHW
jgi:catechol 2,3-dioxygenase-like lactoylglutathione lyase family enzyme